MSEHQIARPIDADSIREHVNAEMSELRSRKRDHAAVLNEILDNLEPVDFHAIAGLEEDRIVSQKIQVVVTVDQVLLKARELNCGLCRNQDFIYAYNGEFWKLIDESELGNFLGQASEKLGVDAITSKYHRREQELVKQFRARAYLRTPKKDNDRVLINLQDCTFEITRNGRKRLDFDPLHFLKYQLPFRYDADSDCPRWKAFLDEVLVARTESGGTTPDKSKQYILAEFMGYVFARHLKLEKTLVLFGHGANGKSVVFEVMNAIFGKDNVSNVSLESISKDQYYRAMLANKLLNFSSEISTRLQAVSFKQLTSGEPIEARLPYGQPMILTDYARLAFNCNELPRDVEHSEAFFRRFLIVPFDVTIPADRRDPNLASEIIESELSGVFNWILVGLDRLLKQNGFSTSDSVDRAIASFKLESDSAAMFVEDEDYRSSSSGWISLKGLYAHYRDYCTDNGVRSLSSKNLIKRLETLGFANTKMAVGKVIYIEK